MQPRTTGASERERPACPTDGRLSRWREEWLRRAGVCDELARRLAADHAIDLHALIELVERGCPPALAARILAPLDREEPRP